ncbi:vomeronasal type-2 receptor 26-like [Engystomops pustulosus]|uniref:vomeronasal type-2 receptor 26-like n=1 Tax=Engystomops pustulosus TaxID=76066 RepID=UPI003AFAEF61
MGGKAKKVVDMELYKFPLMSDCDILPNITLGYHLYDSCGHEKKVIKDVLQILSGHTVTAPNYSCMDHGTVVGFIGDLRSVTSLPMAQLLGMYGYTQLSYGARDSSLSDRRLYPHFFRTVQGDETQYVAVVKLLLYFQWNMVCIFATNDDTGERELRLLRHELKKTVICIEKVVFITQDKQLDASVMEDLIAEVIIFCGTSNRLLNSILDKSSLSIKNKTFIFPTSWSHDGIFLSGNQFNCSLIFSPVRYTLRGLQEIFLSVNPSQHTHDPILEDLWITTFYCFSGNKLKNFLLQDTITVPLRNCNGEERFSNGTHYYVDGSPYKVYMAVKMMAQTLDHIHKTVQTSGINKDNNEFNVYKKKLRHYMRIPCIKGLELSRFCFNHKGEISEPLEILNFINKEIGDTVQGLAASIGSFEESLPPNQQLNISPADIIWINNKTPYSRCSEKCSPGFRKAVKQGDYICCYDCISCSEGEISNATDAENCQKCLPSDWPNEKRDKCIPKIIEFLSYGADVVAYVFLLFYLISSIAVVLITGIFVFFRNTPVVRANNRSLSFIILISLKLSFLSIFLFIGKPEDTTCMFRHISFGIIFTVVLSSILAKTIVVCIAFKATTPDSSWRRWMGVRLPYSVVMILSSIQVLNGIIWMSFSPPYQELDMDSFPGKIIIQCNEGSKLSFYLMLGYMGFLAALSFVLAFMDGPDLFED